MRDQRIWRRLAGVECAIVEFVEVDRGWREVIVCERLSGSLKEDLKVVKGEACDMNVAGVGYVELVL